MEGISSIQNQHKILQASICNFSTGYNNLFNFLMFMFNKWIISINIDNHCCKDQVKMLEKLNQNHFI